MNALYLIKIIIMQVGITGTNNKTKEVLLDKLYDLDYPEIFDLLKYIAKEYGIEKLQVKMKVKKFGQVNIDL